MGARENSNSAGDRGEDPVRIPATLASLAELADTLAHQLKNPLAGIMLAASRLKRSVERLDPEGNAGTVASQLVASVNELSRIIDRVVEAVPVPVARLVPVDVNRLAKQVADRVSPSSGTAGGGLTLHLSPDLPEALADPDLLGLALSDLARFAIESGGDGGPPALKTGASESGEIEFRFLLPGFRAGPEGWKPVVKPFTGAAEGRTLRPAVAGRITGWLGGSFEFGGGPEGGCEILLAFPPAPGPDAD